MLLRIKKKKQLLLAAVFLAIAVPRMAGNEIRNEFFSVENYTRDGSAQSRFQSWSAGLRIANDYPMFGVGVRNSSLFSFRYGADMQGRVIHNQFIQIAADSGYPALLLYVALCLSVFLSLRRARRLAAADPGEEGAQAYAVACGAESSLAVFLIGGMFLSLEVFELPYVMMLLAAQLPLVLRATAASAPSPVDQPVADAFQAPRVAPEQQALTVR